MVKIINFLKINNTHNNYLNLDYLFVVTLKKRQPKLNIIDFNLKIIKLFSVGLLLGSSEKITLEYKKQWKKSFSKFKYILNLILKKNKKDFKNKKIALNFKGFLKKNFLEILFFFEIFWQKNNLIFLSFNPILINNRFFF